VQQLLAGLDGHGSHSTWLTVRFRTVLIHSRTVSPPPAAQQPVRPRHTAGTAIAVPVRFMDAMDTPIDSATQRRRKLRRMAPVFGFAVVAVVALALLTGWLRPSVKRDHIRTAFVEKGEVSATLDASGLVVPQFEQTLPAPWIRSATTTNP